MFKKITKFIKYNTFTAIIIAIAFVAVASALAASNENIKKNVIGEKIVETQGVDNTLLLATDLDNFDLKMEIVNVTEDDLNYYVDYQYKTLGIKDNVWQEILRKKQLVVSKASLEGKDLGAYVSEELGEVIDYEISYLKKVQENEKEKGKTLVQETTKYTGLIGLVLDTKTKELPGYVPVVKPVVSEVSNAPENSGNENSGLSSEETGTPSEPAADDSKIPAGAAYWDQVEKNCLNSGKFWYNNNCNAEPETATPPDSSSQEEDAPPTSETKGTTEGTEPIAPVPPSQGMDKTSGITDGTTEGTTGGTKSTASDSSSQGKDAPPTDETDGTDGTISASSLQEGDGTATTPSDSSSQGEGAGDSDENQDSSAQSAEPTDESCSHEDSATAEEEPVKDPEPKTETKPETETETAEPETGEGETS